MSEGPKVKAGRWLVPEVLQSSLMDCGPAALKAVLEGFGVPVHYDHLRARCATDVDGTSIDALAALGRELGLDSKPILVPRDHLLLPEARALPAIVVTRSGGGLFHFIVVWNTLGPFVQIMDPSSGRRWLHRDRLLSLLPDFSIPIAAARWRRWAETRAAQGAWRRRMRRLGLSRERADALLARAALEPSFRRFARLDAALRLLETLIRAQALSRGRGAARWLEAACPEPDASGSAAPGFEIAPHFWWVSDRDAAPGQLVVHGGVVVHFSRRTSGSSPQTLEAPKAATPGPRRSSSPAASADLVPEPCRRALARSEQRPLALLWRWLWFDAPKPVAALGLALLASSAITPVEVLLLRGLFTLGERLPLEYQRAAALAALIAFAALALWLDLWCALVARRLGTRLEGRLRLALLDKLPRLDDEYLRSRPSSDMAGRGHALHVLRDLPALWAQLARSVLALLFTTAGLVWLHPEGRWLAPLLTIAALGVPLIGRRSLGEISSRLRTHTSALDRFYLDALLGVHPIRVHGAERAVRAEHEDLLTHWSRTARQLHQRGTWQQGLQLGSSTLVALALVLSYVAAQREVAGLLLFAYWALAVPSSAAELGASLTILRNLRGVTLRLCSPLAAPSTGGASEADAAAPGARAPTHHAPGVELRFDGVGVHAGGHRVLARTDLFIPRGAHVAIVGASGAGKSSLLAVLLGWLRPSEGTLLVDGEALDLARLPALRAQTAWVDPAAQLWEQSLYDNVTYGDDRDPQHVLPLALSRSDVVEILERLPDGLQSSLGEAGARVSGGQGQRVRLARALMRRDARLVLLDEPFRGLERPRRRALLGRARAHWPHATLLFVSHDVRDSLGFERVLVIDHGELVEDGAPEALAADPGSHYSALLRADRALEAELWGAAHWRRVSVEAGVLDEPGTP